MYVAIRQIIYEFSIEDANNLGDSSNHQSNQNYNQNLWIMWYQIHNMRENNSDEALVCRPWNADGWDVNTLNIAKISTKMFAPKNARFLKSNAKWH